MTVPLFCIIGTGIPEISLLFDVLKYVIGQKVIESR